MLLEAVEHILAEAARVDDELAEVEEDGGDHGAHDLRRPRLLRRLLDDLVQTSSGSSIPTVANAGGHKIFRMEKRYSL